MALGRTGFTQYVKAAFLWHWNLLAVGAGVALAVLSGKPDVVFPLLMAGEMLYLGLLTTRPRFQKAIDARTAAAVGSSQDDLRLMAEIKKTLHPEAWSRFEELRARCLALQNLAEQMRGSQSAEPVRVREMQTESLERLLWMFLKLIYSHEAVQRFLRTTNRDALVAQISSAEKEIQSAKAKNRSDKLIRSIEDKLETLKQRLTNYDKADENRELLAAEINRIEQKVNAISEMSISARDASDVSAQVDGIADGVSVTEAAIQKLDVMPIFERQTAPKLLSQSH
ncbi:MAG: hypothetical protein AMXMBFR84_27950 [Candidatus Hydrogenedentota bacterium]